MPTVRLPVVDPRPAWREPPADGLRATWLGHSSVLIEIDGLTVLTDPVWGPRASPSRLAGPKRFQPAPVALEQLPPLDLVIVSHDHYELAMPRLGEAVQPARDAAVAPWWRDVGHGAGVVQRQRPATEAPPAGVPWPID